MSFFKKPVNSAESYAQWFRGAKRGDVKAKKREAYISDLEKYELKLVEALVVLSRRLLQFQEIYLRPLKVEIEKIKEVIKNEKDLAKIPAHEKRLDYLETGLAGATEREARTVDEQIALVQKLRTAARQLRKAMAKEEKWTKKEALEIGIELRNMYLSAKKLAHAEAQQSSMHGWWNIQTNERARVKKMAKVFREGF